MVVSGTTGTDSTGVPTRVLVFGMARPDKTIRADDVYAVAEASEKAGLSRRVARPFTVLPP